MEIACVIVWCLLCLPAMTSCSFSVMAILLEFSTSQASVDPTVYWIFLSADAAETAEQYGKSIMPVPWLSILSHLMSELLPHLYITLLFCSCVGNLYPYLQLTVHTSSPLLALLHLILVFTDGYGKGSHLSLPADIKDNKLKMGSVVNRLCAIQMNLSVWSCLLSKYEGITSHTLWLIKAVLPHDPHVH